MFCIIAIKHQFEFQNVYLQKRYILKLIPQCVFCAGDCSSSSAAPCLPVRRQCAATPGVTGFLLLLRATPVVAAADCCAAAHCTGLRRPLQTLTRRSRRAARRCGATVLLQAPQLQCTAQCSYTQSHVLLVKNPRMSYNAPTIRFSRF